MIFSQKNKDRDISEKSKSNVRDLKFTFNIEVEAKHEYHTDEVVKLSITKNLQSTSDSSIKDIKKEVEQIMYEVSNEVESEIDNSRHLSDGFHARKSEENN